MKKTEINALYATWKEAESMRAVIRIGELLTELKQQKGKEFRQYCRDNVDVPANSITAFMVCFEHEDYARHLPSISAVMRMFRPDVKRYHLRPRKVKPEPPPPPDTWNVGDLAEFYYINCESFPEKLSTSFGEIPDVQRFFESYLQVIKSHNGDPNFRSYLDKLTEVKQILMKKHG